MSNFTVPDICDLHDDIRIGDLFLNSYGSINKFYGEVFTAKCEHSNSVVKEIVQKDGGGKVLFINHTGSELCSMVGDQIAKSAADNNWSGIITNGYIRDIEVIKSIPAVLHTPLMSGANALSGVVIVGAILVMLHSDPEDYIALTLGFIAVVLGILNVVGGFAVTNRMLEMFKKKK